MQNSLLLYIGAAVATLSLLAAIVAGLVVCAKPENLGFRYGAFIVPFATIFGAGYYLAATAFSFQYLGVELGIYLGIFFGVALAGLLLAAIRLRTRSKSMVMVQSIPFVLCYPLIPVAIWNVIYAVWIMDRKAKQG